MGQGRWVKDSSNLDEGWFTPDERSTYALRQGTSNSLNYLGKVSNSNTLNSLGKTVAPKGPNPILNAKPGAAGAGAGGGKSLIDPDKMSTGQATELATRKLSHVAGKKLGAAADYSADVFKKGTSALRRGLEDNPGSIGAAAVGAGLGALGLSKLLRRRQAPM